MIVELLKEVREDQKTHSTILIEVQKDVARNTDDLEKHIEGVVQNRKRIVELEKPAQALNFFKKVFLYVGGIAGATLTVMKLIGPT